MSEQIEARTSTANGTNVCYVVEARVSVGTLTEPVITSVQDEVGRPFVLASDWRRVPFARGPVGVPNRLYDQYPATMGYQTYEAAMALAYWFIAQIDRWAVEVRLVRYEHVYTHALTRLAAGSPLKRGDERDAEFSKEQA